MGLDTGARLTQTLRVPFRQSATILADRALTWIKAWRDLPISKWLIGLGIILVAMGLLWPLLSKLGLGRLWGDIVVRREGFTFYFPLMTSLIVSLVISIIIWIFRR